MFPVLERIYALYLIRVEMDRRRKNRVPLSGIEISYIPKNQKVKRVQRETVEIRKVGHEPEVPNFY